MPARALLMRSRRWAGLAGFAMLLAARPVSAVCPTDLCDCLGEAGHFALVGTDVSIRPGIPSPRVYGYPVQSSVDTSVCATTADLFGKLHGETAIGDDVILTDTTGTAGELKGYRAYGGYAYPGVLIGGDLATGGGFVKGLEFGVIMGATDMRGRNPRVAACARAADDAQAASTAFSLIPPTQIITNGRLVAIGAIREINATAGVNVIRFGDLILKAHRQGGYTTGSVLNINLAPNTDSVIVNVTGKLAIDRESQIKVNGGDIEDVIINLIGKRPSLKINADATVEPAILAPGRTVLVDSYAQTANLYAARTKIKGTTIAQALLCP